MQQTAAAPVPWSESRDRTSRLWHLAHLAVGAQESLSPASETNPVITRPSSRVDSRKLPRQSSQTWLKQQSGSQLYATLLDPHFGHVSVRGSIFINAT